MCGIAGVVHWSGRPVTAGTLEKMTGALAHRGPDDHGYFINGQGTGLPGHPRYKSIPGKANVGLGHRRLSIIDLSSGHQPLSNEDDTVWITFNGEIYNFQSIRKTLEDKGHRFKTRSDTEVIVHAYEAWGQDCIRRFNGMFAFVIWDKKKNRIFAARDRLGIKPLYYANTHNFFLFGSEIKALLQYPDLEKKLRLESVQDFLSLAYIPAPYSIYDNIFKLPAGHTLTAENGRIHLTKYWDIDFSTTEQRREQEWQQIILESLKNAVARRLISDVPLGAFLSGGIDSSAVVGLMSSLIDQPVKTASIGFNDDKFNELHYAGEISEKFKTDHHARKITADAFSLLDKMVWYFDEPFGDSSLIPTYFVSQVARQKVTVALSGDGGDENFAGYRRYYYDNFENRIRKGFPQFLRKSLIKWVASVYPKADRLPQFLRAKTLLTNLSLDPVDGYYNTMTWFHKFPNLFNENSKRKLGNYHSSHYFLDHLKNANTDDPLSAIQYIDFKTYLVDDILTKVDRASMAHALEVRVPLLDHNFIQTVARIPSSLKLKGRQGKYIFKKSLESMLPRQTLYRKKMGFSIPLESWLKNELPIIFEKNVLSAQSFCSAYMNMDLLKGKWQDYLSGRANYTNELWMLLFLEKWGRKWM